MSWSRRYDLWKVTGQNRPARRALQQIRTERKHLDHRDFLFMSNVGVSARAFCASMPLSDSAWQRWIGSGRQWIKTGLSRASPPIARQRRVS
jgi:hypothetical protein